VLLSWHITITYFSIVARLLSYIWQIIRCLLARSKIACLSTFMWKGRFDTRARYARFPVHTIGVGSRARIWQGIEYRDILNKEYLVYAVIPVTCLVSIVNPPLPIAVGAASAIPHNLHPPPHNPSLAPAMPAGQPQVQEPDSSSNGSGGASHSNYHRAY
jgi:hypothetical protein